MTRIEREYTIKLIRELAEKRLPVYANIQDKRIQIGRLLAFSLFLLAETEFRDLGARIENIFYKEQG